MRPVPGEFYRHFKNKDYQVLAIAKHSETKEELVIYQALYGDFGIYARPLDMFTSEVDHVKYPEVKQKMRFMKIERSDLVKDVPVSNVPVSKVDNAEVDSQWADSRILEYLDADTYSEKLEVMQKYRDKLDSKLIDAVAGSLDLVVDPEKLDESYNYIISHLKTNIKYDTTRLR
ncbi:MAG TPA: DUF1653 domain-containing protein [Eubacterium sp.]|nr:DUF1653 domain-containing protein [Eubacterium sp.]